MSNTIYLALGSNMCRQVAYTHAMIHLSQVLTDIKCSKIYETKPLHAIGPNFYNAVIVGKTELRLSEFVELTKKIEQDLGRAMWIDSFNKISKDIRCLDIDVLLFNNEFNKEYNLPREDVYKYPFVIKPLYEISPDLEIADENQKVKLLDILNKTEITGLTLVSDWNLERYI